jgi:hypothetical protein
MHGPVSLVLDTGNCFNGVEEIFMLGMPLDVRVEKEGVSFRMNILHHNLEAVEAASFHSLNLIREMLGSGRRHICGGTMRVVTMTLMLSSWVALVSAVLCSCVVRWWRRHGGLTTCHPCPSLFFFLLFSPSLLLLYPLLLLPYPCKSFEQVIGPLFDARGDMEGGGG